MLNKKYTFATWLIKLTFPKKERTCLLASLFFGVPALVLLTFFFIQRRAELAHDATTIFFAYLACFWCFVGPSFIWRQEYSNLKQFWFKLRKCSADKRDFYKIKSLYKYSVINNKFNRIFLLLWWLLVMLAFLTSYDFMVGFGVRSPIDYWWFIQIIGVAGYAYFTGVGFLHVIRTLKISHSIKKHKIKLNIYHPDKRGGLGFLGKFFTETCFMFASGSLYIPILLKLYDARIEGSCNYVLALIVIYALMIGLSFAYPMYIFHKIIEKQKNGALIDIGNKLNLLIKSNFFDKHCNNSFEQTLRNRFQDVQHIVTWPFNIENATTVTISILLPIILTFTQILVSKNIF